MLCGLILELKEDVANLKAERPVEERPAPKFGTVQELIEFSPDTEKQKDLVSSIDY